MQLVVRHRIVDLANVRVLQLAGERCLRHEKLPVELAAFRVVEERRGDELDRDIALGKGVVAQVDLGSRAGSEAALDRILPDLLQLERLVQERSLSARACAPALF
jgi:hypothetical protein